MTIEDSCTVSRHAKSKTISTAATTSTASVTAPLDPLFSRTAPATAPTTVVTATR